MNNRLSNLISITVCPPNLCTSIKLKPFKQLVIVYQGHVMHFQQIIQQNNENLASTKQCFTVGTNILLNQPPINQLNMQLLGPEGNKGITAEPVLWLAIKDLKLLSYLSVCVLFIVLCLF